jgi:hypothetical protein
MNTSWQLLNLNHCHFFCYMVIIMVFPILDDRRWSSRCLSNIGVLHSHHLREIFHLSASKSIIEEPIPMMNGPLFDHTRQFLKRTMVRWNEILWKVAQKVQTNPIQIYAEKVIAWASKDLISISRLSSIWICKDFMQWSVYVFAFTVCSKRLTWMINWEAYNNNNRTGKADPQQVVTKCHSHTYRTLGDTTSSTLG